LNTSTAGNAPAPACIAVHDAISRLERLAVFDIAGVHPISTVGREQAVMSRDFQRLITLERQLDDIVARVPHPARHGATLSGRHLC